MRELAISIICATIMLATMQLFAALGIIAIESTLGDSPLSEKIIFWWAWAGAIGVLLARNLFVKVSSNIADLLLAD